MLARRVLSVPVRFAATPAGVPPSLVGDKYEETYGFGFNQDIPADTPAFAEMVAKRNEAAHIAQLKDIDGWEQHVLKTALSRADEYEARRKKATVYHPFQKQSSWFTEDVYEAAYFYPRLFKANVERYRRHNVWGLEEELQSTWAKPYAAFCLLCLLIANSGSQDSLEGPGIFSVFGEVMDGHCQ
ncbi:Oidioi.mRNA.OKI2018_I69.XSR.g14418.t1.cds [Oikopleura dioica]|uniref:Oidioi.mRNA.OKI2018_I69.XSR.g14418.t1.cds n=1 Tax=Oikopleura dioica TaxID=34765 RepID=A0ABN7S9T9_OIKDI|nr:Oidioi.mRNA.OKI2018_I69.XSR.g14418.t1.cds [Oikopleura dioica]